MKLRLLRNATLKLEILGRTVLIDPFFAPKGSRPSFTGRAPNPLVELAASPEEILDGVELVIVSHLHADHFDPVAQSLVPKHLPLICQPGDEDKIRSHGFSDVIPLAKVIDWNGIRLQRREGSHGLGPVVQKMGPVMGFSINAKDEPTIYSAVTQPRSYLENVSQHGDEVDFYDTNYTSNGRATFPFDVIESAAADEIAEAHFLLILNKNENIVPAVAKLEGPQAAAFFMLGETTGTSAGGADEAGKFLRVPGTNPFFPMPHDLQGNRFLELLAENPLEVYVMNTGRVGGPEEDERSSKVRIKHSSAIVKGIAEGTIEWELDPDFGYFVASSVPGIDDLDVLQPRRLYAEQGREDEYGALVERFKAERAEFLSGFPSLSDEIVAAVS